MKSEPSKIPVEAGGKLSSLFFPEDGSHMFLRSIGILPDYMTLQPRKPYFS
jgi:hypothetical protein